MPGSASIIGNSSGKEERLKSKKLISLLFEKGYSANGTLLKILWLPVALDSTSPAQTGFSVPKRKFPRAVDRNKIKRRLRESFRLNKNAFYEYLVNQQCQIALMILYKGRSIPAFNELETEVRALLKKVANDHETSVSKNDSGTNEND